MVRQLLRSGPSFLPLAGKVAGSNGWICFQKIHSAGFFVEPYIYIHIIYNLWLCVEKTWWGWIWKSFLHVPLIENQGESANRYHSIISLNGFHWEMGAQIQCQASCWRRRQTSTNQCHNLSQWSCHVSTLPPTFIGSKDNGSQPKTSLVSFTSKFGPMLYHQIRSYKISPFIDLLEHQMVKWNPPSKMFANKDTFPGHKRWESKRVDNSGGRTLNSRVQKSWHIPLLNCVSRPVKRCIKQFPNQISKKTDSIIQLSRFS